MISDLDSGSCGRCSNHDPGEYFVFLDKSLISYSRFTSVHPVVKPLSFQCPPKKNWPTFFSTCSSHIRPPKMTRKVRVTLSYIRFQFNPNKVIKHPPIKKKSHNFLSIGTKKRLLDAKLAHNNNLFVKGFSYFG